MKNAEGDEVLKPEGKSKVWNYHPNLPVPNSPVFRFPTRILFVLNWFRRGWLGLSATTLWVTLAFVTYNWFQPSLEHWSIHAIGMMFLRNLALITIIAGGLHLWLWIMRRQGDQLKFDSRDMMRDNGTFTFRNQVLDNMFWSIAWGVPIWTLYEVIYFRAVDNGLAPTFQFSDNPVWFILFFWVILLWKGFHFYWVHRFLHWPPYYRIAHAVHHRNLNTGPWSGLSMHPLETLPYLSSLLIHLVDAGADDPVGDLRVVERELAAYGHGLVERPRLLVLNKQELLLEEITLQKILYTILRTTYLNQNNHLRINVSGCFLW